MTVLYDGISRVANFFKIDLRNLTDTVSIDRLKPAHLDTNAKLPAVNPRDAPTFKSTASPEPQVRKTRSGLHVHFQSATFLSFIVNL